MKEQLYQQCVLVKDSRVTTTWIPSKFAKIGKYLKLRRNITIARTKYYTEWEDGWLVTTVYKKKISKEELAILGIQYKDTRETSDI